MSELTLQSWEQEFRSAAKADKLATLRDHLRGLDVRIKPELILEGTIQVVQACSAYMKMEGRSYAHFLATQTYDPFQSPSAKYAFTFSLCDRGFARVLVTHDLRGLDLADLYGHTWYKYKVIGFDHIWITPADRSDLGKRDFVKLERQVTDDLRFDYTEEELDISFDAWFDEYHTAWVLVVSLQDRKDVVTFLRVNRSEKAIKTLETM
jgi:hypothetical protein